MAVLDRAMNNGERSDEVHGALMEMATLGGIAISNVRTGNIHEAAGALLEMTDLSHPETLFVFFRDAIEQYSEAIGDREARLLSQLRLVPAFGGFVSMGDMIGWWEDMFARTGLDLKIQNSVSKLKPSLGRVRDHVFQRVCSDKVWINKESPLVLNEADIRNLIDGSLARFGLTE
jgi:alcohol dehydrogenase class IV